MMIFAQFNLFGFLPEPVWMLLFGSALIAFTGALRWVFNRRQATSNDESFDSENSAQRKSLREKLS